MLKRFVDKVAVITGASQGIGFSIAEILATEGAIVYLVDIDKIQGEVAAKTLVSKGLRAHFIACDITSEKALQSMVSQIKEEAVHVLCNNAGVELSKGVETTTIEEWDLVSNVNLRGPFMVTKVLLPLLEVAKGAAIVNTASISGLVGWPESMAYCASKGGVVMLTKQMACDLAVKQIRVNCICPGTTRTPMIERLIGSGPEAEKEAHDIAERHLLKRFAEPREIAQAAVFLASKEASFVTGAVLPVDGGYTAK
ncbi:MAG: SDR family oxidoreductase [Bacilli bacterium]|jgi:NAD(P)-dependent dehydrogenase (short-subunit alcohol dehydrogenase family)|nr:SDR family oxidoreductase [Sphaerochaetaceae bacterium]MDD4219132.1 SDR family oxidoreductase [Sphaerochaetaceae bacterium]